MKKILFFFLVLISCQNRPVSKDKTDNKIFIDLEKAAVYEMNNLFSNVQINPIETSDSSLIGNISKLIINKNRLYVFDKRQKAILTFNMNGKFINKFCRVGSGPGEYLNIEDCTINSFNNTIMIINGYSLSSYNLNGKFIKKTKITDDNIKAIHQIEAINDSTIAILALFENQGALLYSTNTEKIIKKQEIIPKWTRSKIPFNISNRLYRNNNIVIYREGFSNKVYTVNEQGYNLRYEWDFGKYNFNYNEPPLLEVFKKASSTREIKSNREYYFNKYAIQFQHNVENKDYIITCFMHKNKPTTLIYNKISDIYKVIKGDISKLMMFSQIDLIDSNKIIVVANPTLINMISEKCFSEKNKEIVKNISISDNPVIIRLLINDL